MNHHEVPRDENVTGIPSNESSNSESKFLDFLGIFISDFLLKRTGHLV